MSILDAGLIQRSLAEASLARLDHLEVFGSIASTNTHLLTQAAPPPGRFHVALADHQTSGRGRHNRRWLSPPGAGLCLSMAYTFAEPPEHLPALTLAIGVGIVDALQSLDIGGVSLKWPNDVVARDAKLGGVLTEVQSSNSEGITVVTGIGMNIDLPGEPDFGMESNWAQRAIDLKHVCPDYPQKEQLAAAIISSIHVVMATFEVQGFAGFVAEWQQHDWLRGKEITVDHEDRQETGIAAGVDTDGALLVDTEAGRTRVISGSIVVADVDGTSQ